MSLSEDPNVRSILKFCGIVVALVTAGVIYTNEAKLSRSDTETAAIKIRNRCGKAPTYFELLESLTVRRWGQIRHLDGTITFLEESCKNRDTTEAVGRLRWIRKEWRKKLLNGDPTAGLRSKRPRRLSRK